MLFPRIIRISADRFWYQCDQCTSVVTYALALCDLGVRFVFVIYNEEAEH